MFIAIEGLEGASKSTSLKTITSTLQSHGITNIIEVREPGGTPLAESLRSLLKSFHSEKVSSETELMLMMASRHQLYNNVIIDALQQGKTVLSDRSWWSTFAYQIVGRSQSLTLFSTLYDVVLRPLPAHDLMIYLDIDPAIGMQRATKRGELDRIELQDISFFERAREGYKQLATLLPEHTISINAEPSMEQVQTDLQHKIQRWLALENKVKGVHPNFSTLLTRNL